MKRTSYSTGTPWEPLVGYSRAVRPATSIIEVSRLIDPAMLIEIEADAVVGEYHSEYEQRMAEGEA